MAGKRVAVLTPDGKFGTVDEAEVEQMPDGSRILTAKEAAQREDAQATQAARQAVQERYDALPTGRKVLGAASLITAPITGAATISSDAPPTLAALGAGARKGLGLGLLEAGTRKTIDAIGGKEAGAKYATQLDQEQAASPVAHGAGELIGTATGAALGSAGGAVARAAIPSAGITALGDLAEHGVGRALSSVAARGTLGRAAVSAAELGARGALEGGLYSAAQAETDALLHDKDMSAEKIFAATGTGLLWGGLGGAALGAAGSLAKSGVGAVMRGAIEEGGAPRVGTRATEALQGMAQEQAWKSVGAGYGLQTTRFAKQAERVLPNGVRDLGEVALRHGIIDATEGPWAAAMNGRPADMLGRIEAAEAKVGTRLGDLTSASGAVVPAAKIESLINDVAMPFEGKAGQRHVAASVRDYGAELKDVLGLTGGADSVSVQSLLDQRKALDQIVYQETKALDPKMRVQAMRDVRAKMEEVITGALDDASGRMKGDLATEYKGLKKDFFALRILGEAAEDSAARASKGATFGLTDTLRSGTGATVGGMIAGPVGATVGGVAGGVASKFIRERGNAASAVALHNLANSKFLAGLVAKTDSQITSASRGLLTTPGKGAIPMPSGKARVRAENAMKIISALQADPDAAANRIAAHTEHIDQASPELGQAVAERHAAALTFLASKMPSGADKDPMDPHPMPRMTDAEAHTFANYAWYTEQPDRFFAEMKQGKLTYEGAETAQALMPRAFAELQARMTDAIATHMARGRSVPFQQRLKIGDVLGVAAVPAQGLAHASFLQQNVVPLTETNKPAPARKQAAQNTQQSALDRLEARGPGRH